jgi:hypothetical protein
MLLGRWPANGRSGCQEAPPGPRGAQAERARGRDAAARVLPEPGVSVEEGMVIVDNEMALVGPGTGGTA